MELNGPDIKGGIRLGFCKDSAKIPRKSTSSYGMVNLFLKLGENHMTRFVFKSNTIVRCDSTTDKMHLPCLLAFVANYR